MPLSPSQRKLSRGSISKALMLCPDTRIQAGHHPIDDLAQSRREPLRIRNLLRADGVRDMDRCPDDLQRRSLLLLSGLGPEEPLGPLHHAWQPRDPPQKYRHELHVSPTP